MPIDKTVPYLYRAKLRSADGREAMSDFVVEHDAGGQGQDPDAPAQMYRFKVRTADGTETIRFMPLRLPAGWAGRSGRHEGP